MLKIKKIVVLLFVCSVLLISLGFSPDKKILSVRIVDLEIIDSEVLPQDIESEENIYLINKTTMVPLSVISEDLGYDTYFDEKTKEIHITDSNTSLLLKIGSSTVKYNNTINKSIEPPVVIDNIVYVPLRFISENFNKYVFWDCQSLETIIWISDVQLLSDKDVEVTDNYYVDPDFDIGDEEGFYSGWYSLKQDKKTYRGLKLSDTYERVIELYGEPHRIHDEKEGKIELEYTRIHTPFTSDSRELMIEIKNNIVERIYILI